jgi:hypothetical protein
MMSRKRHRDEYREGHQVPTCGATVNEIMSDPAFALGVADVRAGRGFRPDFDLWSDANDQWGYERGRQWAVLAPRSVRLKRDGKITETAENWFVRHAADIC